MSPSCAHCYAVASGPLGAVACGTCDRSYCSAACRTSDWRLGHSQWCGRSCEAGCGYVIKDAGGLKGMGVFALRDFEAGEKIIVESSALQARQNSPLAQGDLQALAPSVSVGTRTACL